MKRNYRSIDAVIRRHAGRRSVNSIARRARIGAPTIIARAERAGIDLRPVESTDRFLRRSA